MWHDSGSCFILLPSVSLTRSLRNSLLVLFPISIVLLVFTGSLTSNTFSSLHLRLKIHIYGDWYAKNQKNFIVKILSLACVIMKIKHKIFSTTILEQGEWNDCRHYEFSTGFSVTHYNFPDLCILLLTTLRFLSHRHHKQTGMSNCTLAIMLKIS